MRLKASIVCVALSFVGIRMKREDSLCSTTMSHLYRPTNEVSAQRTLTPLRGLPFQGRI